MRFAPLTSLSVAAMGLSACSAFGPQYTYTAQSDSAFVKGGGDEFHKGLFSSEELPTSSVYPVKIDNKHLDSSIKNSHNKEFAAVPLSPGHHVIEFELHADRVRNDGLFDITFDALPRETYTIKESIERNPSSFLDHSSVKIIHVVLEDSQGKKITAANFKIENQTEIAVDKIRNLFNGNSN